MQHKLSLKTFVSAVILILWMTPITSTAQDTFMMPPAEVAALVDAPSAPSLQISRDNSFMLLLHSPGRPSIEDVAQPELRLAGTRINPRTNGPSRAGYVNRITIKDAQTLQERDVTGLPENPVIQNVSLSPDSRHIAFTLTRTNHIELWITDVASGQARRLGDVRINNTWAGSPLDWSPDSQFLLARTIPANRGAAPEQPIAPTGPIIQEATGAPAPARTFQDLLANPHDEALFDYYFTSEITRVALNGSTTRFAEPAIYSRTAFSPDGRFLLVGRVVRPYSYTVPGSRFPNVTDVRNMRGEVVAVITEQPLLDNIPIAPNSTFEGRRSITWRNDAPSTLFFVEAQDGGDSRNQVEFRDIAYLLDAPFTGEPVELARLQHRYAGIAWANNGLAFINETWRATRTSRTWHVQPGTPSAEPRLIFDLNFEDRYGNPGSPEFIRNEFGQNVMHLSPDGTEIFMTGIGASPEGNRPFLRAMHLETLEMRELWRSASPYFETVVNIVDAGATRIITRRESVNEPPNFFERNLADGSERTLTSFPHPTPELIDVPSEFVQFERADGLTLTGQLLLPVGYDAERDGRLPLVIWAYPREFASAAAAGQVSDSPYRFNSISFWGPHFLVTQGYAVLANAAMPIVAPAPDIEPNESFIEQLTLNAEAGIDFVVDRGIADRNRVAIGGHSYGAFMTANLLAHTDLFKAGIARSGAYNRSLTPFGFQAEPRNIWEARDTYIRMSPFFYAHQIKTPILFIHGDADNNSGTFPMQSERMFAAVRGTGGTARLVMLPHESHGYRARESLMHMLWETIEWLDTYVKNAE
ncbi:MAG: prolyl oligopeptidase family serine peptidase [Balneolales bacterium]|nr:prolyl oligopeptidase family serine peptidase [Balneolales bacterium]